MMFPSGEALLYQTLIVCFMLTLLEFPASVLEHTSTYSKYSVYILHTDVLQTLFSLFKNMLLILLTL